MNSVHNHIHVKFCDDAADAISKGYDWNKVEPPVKPIQIKEVIVVRKGTEAGNATVDFLLEDETGQRFVFMITANLLRVIL